MTSMDGIRRITIDSETDWARIQDNVKQGINASMENRLATLPGGKNGEQARHIRKELETRLAKVREEMFKLSHPNLLVNGHNYEDYVEATEPFDEALDRKIWSLDVEKVEWITQVAEKRKQTPRDIRDLEDSLERRRTEAEYDPDEEEETAAVGRKEVDIPAPPRHQEVVETFQEVASNLSELAQVAPAQLQRAQRAQTVREEIGNMAA